MAPVTRRIRARLPSGPGTPRARALLPALGSLFALLALGGCGSSGSSASEPARTTKLVSIGAGLEGPAGLRASVYAHGPQTTAAFAFDPQGRLWVSAAGLEAHTHDGVYVIDKAGAAAVKVIGGLDDPLGIAWVHGRLYVASLGRVDAFSDFNGKRFTKRSEILRGPVSGGENNALVLAPDGRLVMGITAGCDHCTPPSKFSGAVVSFKPDGGDLRVFASRIRAPVGLAYFPGTSDLLVTMNQRDDLGARTPGDWLALVREGQYWGFPACYGQGGAVCAGVPAPIAELHKHAAVGGIAVSTGELGASVGTAAIVAEWNTGKVQQVALAKTADGYTGTVKPFVTGIAKPLAVTTASGGALLLGDWETGTIYRLARG